MVTKARAYLDWNATAPLRPQARAVLTEALDLTGNPSSVHSEGRAARGTVERARAQVAALVGAEAAQVTFTSGGTEANMMALSPGWSAGKSPIRATPALTGCWCRRSNILRPDRAAVSRRTGSRPLR